MAVLETVFVITLFLIYLILWKVKKVKVHKISGIDPDVMSKSKSNVQIYMSRLSRILTIYAALIIVLHSLQIRVGSLFSKAVIIDTVLFDIIGFTAGFAGLSLCLYAQTKMGNSWRVGIDEKMKTELVTTGLYKYIRNPTYLGLFLLNTGVWLIWPTWAVFILNLVFVLFLDIQVRCEEDFLLSVHGQRYVEYKNRTKRYIPFIY